MFSMWRWIGRSADANGRLRRRADRIEACTAISLVIALAPETRRPGYTPRAPCGVRRRVADCGQLPSKLRQVALDLPIGHMCVKIPPFLLLERYEGLVEVLAHDRARERIAAKAVMASSSVRGSVRTCFWFNSVSFRWYMFTLIGSPGSRSCSTPSSPAANIMAAAR